MTLSSAVEAIWSDMQALRARLLAEVAGLSQAQADWRPSEAGMQAPPAVRPERGLELARLLDDLGAVRARSRQSIEKIVSLDPRRLTFKHFALGELNIAQWWMLQAGHDAAHLTQIRGVKAAPDFPAA